MGEPGRGGWGVSPVSWKQDIHGRGNTVGKKWVDFSKFRSFSLRIDFFLQQFFFLSKASTE